MLPASVTAVGKQVAGREAPMPRWSASSSWQRRPCGPSATLTDSRPSRGMPLSCQKLRPEHSDAACGDSVIVSEAACGACDSDARAYVQYPTPSAQAAAPQVRAARRRLVRGSSYARCTKVPRYGRYMSTQRGVLLQAHLGHQGRCRLGKLLGRVEHIRIQLSKRRGLALGGGRLHPPRWRAVLVEF